MLNLFCSAFLANYPVSNHFDTMYDLFLYEALSPVYNIKHQFVEILASK